MSRRHLGRARLVTPVLIATLAGVLGCSLASKPQAWPTPTPTAFSEPGAPLSLQATPASPPAQTLTVPEVASRVRPAVVQVTNQQEVGPGQFGGPVPETAGIGSGVIYDTSGLVLTNDHVVEGADQLLVALPDGRTFQGRVLGQDAQSDLAVVKIEGQNLPAATLGSAGNLVVGQTVVAIGNALALAGGPTVTQGIVSALGRAIDVPSAQAPGTPSATGASTFLFDLIQTDAPINPGNSGGPLVDLQAQVVGINTLIAATTESGTPVEGIGFAISIDTAKRIAGQLVSTGRAAHPFLGIEYAPLNPALAARLDLPVQRGALVTGVVANSPAAQAGLQEGDLIVSADGRTLEAESSLAQVIDGKQPGDTLELTILRNGVERTVQATLAQQP